MLEGTEDHIKNMHVLKQMNVNVKNKQSCFITLPLTEDTEYRYMTHFMSWEKRLKNKESLQTRPGRNKHKVWDGTCGGIGSNTAWPPSV